MSDVKSTASPITSCFIYNKMAGYTKIMTDAIMHAERINKNTEAFVEDVALEVKRANVQTQ